MLANTAISPSDTMFDSTIERYMDVGLSALSAIKAVVGQKEIASILDLPCGHGRVARHFSSEYPEASLFVSDLDEVGMQFCVETFDAKRLQSLADFDQVNFGMKFDLIWSGSLITHFDENDTKSFFRFVSRHLSCDGIAVVTSHGDFVAERLRTATGWMYGLPDEAQISIYDQAQASGYGYRRYPGWDVEYGISLSSTKWLKSAASGAGLEMTEYLPAAWDNHQDVFGLKLI